MAQQTLITESAGTLIVTDGIQNILIAVSAGVSIGNGNTYSS